MEGEKENVRQDGGKNDGVVLVLAVVVVVVRL